MIKSRIFAALAALLFIASSAQGGTPFFGGGGAGGGGGSGGGGVSSFTGDGTFLNNSASTGAVTGTAANAPANSILGNNTGTAAAPAYQNSINITGTAATAAQTVTSASANALAAGLAGATNPALNVDASTASSATGLNIKSAAAGGGVALSTLSSGTNETLNLAAKGTGTVKLGSGLTSVNAATLGVGCTNSSTDCLIFPVTGSSGVYFSTTLGIGYSAGNNSFFSGTTAGDIVIRGAQNHRIAMGIDNGSGSGTPTAFWVGGAGGYLQMLNSIVYPASSAGIASASSITPTGLIQHVTGTAAIATITLPNGFGTTTGSCLTFIADGAWTTTTAGNIFAAMTAVAGVPYQGCYDGTKWYIK